MTGQDSEKKIEAGSGGLEPVLGDPRIAPGSGIVEPTKDDITEGQRDLSTNQVGDPLYKLPPEDGRDTWGWEHSQIDNILVALYFIMNGATPPPVLHAQLVEFVNREVAKLPEEERQKMIEAVNKVKSLPPKDP